MENKLLQYCLLILSMIFVNNLNLYSAARISTISDNKLIFSHGRELINAARKGNNKKIEDLINQGADINFQDSGGDTALMGATFHDHLETVKLLIQLGANINAPSTRIINGSRGSDVTANTALMIAVNKGNKNIVMLLLDNKADADITDVFGDSALIRSVNFYNNNRKTNFEMSKLLINAGADVNIKNAHGENALRRAVSTGGDSEYEIIRFLIDSGCDIECDSEIGTPLYLAVANICKDILLLLLNNGVNINDSYDSKTILDIALEVSAGLEVVVSGLNPFASDLPKAQQIVDILKAEPERRKSEINKWQLVAANKITKGTDNLLIKDISRIVSEYVIGTYIDVVKLEREDRINKWQELIASNIAEATDSVLNKKISKIVSEYLLGSIRDVSELENNNNLITKEAIAK